MNSSTEVPITENTNFHETKQVRGTCLSCFWGRRRGSADSAIFVPFVVPSPRSAWNPPVLYRTALKSIFAASLAAIACGTSAQAGIIYSESFDYGATDGALAGKNGGTGFSEAWTAGNPGISYAGTGLSFSELSVSGGMVTATGANGVGNAKFARRVATTSQTNVYYGSFLTQIVNTSQFRVKSGMGFGSQNASFSSNSFKILTPDNDSALRLDDRNSGSSLTIGQTYLTLFKINTLAGSTTVWLLSEAQFDVFKGGGITEAELDTVAIGTGPSQLWARSSVIGGSVPGELGFGFFLNIIMNIDTGVSATLAADEYRLADTSLNEVIFTVPTFNTATNAGLEFPSNNGLVNLATTTGVSPVGGTFSGPGTSGGNFNPEAAGYGLYTLTYAFNGESSSFTIAVTGGLTLVSEGGSLAPNNLAPAGTAFGKDVFLDNPNYSIPHLNDGLYSNSSSWLGTSANSFAGISLGSTPIAINRLAFGRDSTGNSTDRAAGVYTVQFTTEANPTAATTAWTSIGAVFYPAAGNAAVPNPALRHVFSFPTVNATGLRIIASANGTAIDEIELYAPTGLFTTGSLALLQEGGTFAPDNLARSSGAIAFSKDEFGDPHFTASLNNGSYGNASSWIGNSTPSFAAIALGQSRPIDRIAFGRDNTGTFTDCCLGNYTVQYTNVAAPNAATPDTSWTTIGQLDYQTAVAPIASPALRHLYSFTPVTATAVRIIAPAAVAIDEIEIYQGKPILTLVQRPSTVLTYGVSSVDFGNIAPGAISIRSFIVRNPGSSTLTLQSVTVDSDYFIGSLSSRTLAPGGSATFAVISYPAAYGPRIGTLHLLSNDPAIPDFGILLFANALTPIEAWRGQKFGTIVAAGNSADLFDPNNNGIPNLLEYALGGEPVLTTTGTTILPKGSIVGNRLQLEFTRDPKRNDLNLTVEVSENLLTWTPLAHCPSGTSTFNSQLPGTTINQSIDMSGLQTVQVQDLTLTTEPNNSRRFLRLRATR